MYVRIHDKLELFTFNKLNGMMGVSGFCQYMGLMWWISYPITSYDNVVSCIATVVVTSKLYTTYGKIVGKYTLLLYGEWLQV